MKNKNYRTHLGMILITFAALYCIIIFFSAVGAQIPIVYANGYNISTSPQEDFLAAPQQKPTVDFKIELEDIMPMPDIKQFEQVLQTFPFDGCKYGKIAQHLCKTFKIPELYQPMPIAKQEMLRLLSHYLVQKGAPTEQLERYFASLEHNQGIAAALGLPMLSDASEDVVHLIKKHILAPMILATGGTLRACQLALESGWAINLGGGYHHASATHGGGFCIYPDIILAILALWEHNPALKVLIVDLDAHRGNGHEEFFAGDPRVAIFDMFNQNAYPRTTDPESPNIYLCPLKRQTTDDEYLTLLNTQLPPIIHTQNPDLIIYNAGSDILIGDSIGDLAVTPRGMIERDRFIFDQAKRLGKPIAMVLSGGYTSLSTNTIKQSLSHLLRTKIPRKCGRCTIL